MQEAGIEPGRISYIEAHGTGTSLGDPIEIAGLAKAFGSHPDKSQRCWLGSAKSNIGHCESAAGIAGLTKVLLQMKHRQSSYRRCTRRSRIQTSISPRPPLC